MSRIRPIMVLALVAVLTLAFASSSAFAKGQKGQKKGSHPIAGKVTAVDQSSITLETKKAGAKQFKLTATTVYEKAGSEPNVPATPATLADVKTGHRVKIAASGDEAKTVTMHAKAKGAKVKGQGKHAKKPK